MSALRLALCLLGPTPVVHALVGALVREQAGPSLSRLLAGGLVNGKVTFVEVRR